MRIARHTALVACLFLLAGCIAPPKVSKVRQDAATFRTQQDERDAYDHCSENAVPGSMEHMECMAAMTRGAGTPAK